MLTQLCEFIGLIFSVCPQEAKKVICQGKKVQYDIKFVTSQLFYYKTDQAPQAAGILYLISWLHLFQSYTIYPVQRTLPLSHLSSSPSFSSFSLSLSVCLSVSLFLSLSYSCLISCLDCQLMYVYFSLCYDVGCEAWQQHHDTSNFIILNYIFKAWS